MPTDEQKKQYNANRSAKRAKDKYEALPETRALRGELDALKKSIAGEQVYMGGDDEYKVTWRHPRLCECDETGSPVRDISYAWVKAVDPPGIAALRRKAPGPVEST